MPDLSNLDDSFYKPEDPYHFHYDNLPIKSLLEKIQLINAQTDINANILRGSNGSVGSLSIRLNESLEGDGRLKTEAVNNSLHNIAFHEDGEKDGVDYVKMKLEERSKLSLIESGANNLTIEIESISSTPLISTGLLRLKTTDTINYNYTQSGLEINTNFPVNSAHIHNYNKEPVHANVSTPDYKNYKVNSISSDYIAGSLRVYVNGIRLNSTDPVRVPEADDVNIWTLTYIESENNTSGTFSFNRTLKSSDIICIDFDENYL